MKTLRGLPRALEELRADRDGALREERRRRHPRHKGDHVGDDQQHSPDRAGHDSLVLGTARLLHEA